LKCDDFCHDLQFFSKFLGQNCLAHYDEYKFVKYFVKEDNLLYVIVDLCNVILDELYFFLRLWDFILDILLLYIERFNCEERLKRIAKKLSVIFIVLNSVDNEKY
jgi:hypothetical protein